MNNNILVIHELYDDFSMYCFRLSADYETALTQAKRVFRKEVQTERDYGYKLNDERTYWDADEAHGELVWAEGQKATYDVLSDEYMCDYEKEYGQRTNLAKG